MNIINLLQDDPNKPQRTNAELLAATSIRYRQVKYTEDGLEDTRDISEKEFAKVEQSGKSKQGDDIVWTRHFNNENKYDRTEAQVVGTELQDLLKVMLSHDPRLHFSSDGDKNDITLVSPFEPLLHIWPKLEKLTEGETDEPQWTEVRDRFKEMKKATRKGIVLSPLVEIEDRLRKAKKDLTTLLDHIRATQEVSSYFSSGLDASKTSGTIQFEYLWTLFPPGELIISTVFMKQPQIFIVKESLSYITYENERDRDREQKQQKRYWTLDCWSYDWNGKKFNRVPITFKFDNFQGSRKINTLPCYPLKYRDDAEDTDNEQLKTKLIERGKLFWDYCTRKPGKQMLDYDGDAVNHGSGFQKLKTLSNQVS